MQLFIPITFDKSNFDFFSHQPIDQPTYYLHWEGYVFALVWRFVSVINQKVVDEFLWNCGGGMPYDNKRFTRFWGWWKSGSGNFFTFFGIVLVPCMYSLELICIDLNVIVCFWPVLINYFDSLTDCSTFLSFFLRQEIDARNFRRNVNLRGEQRWHEMKCLVKFWEISV